MMYLGQFRYTMNNQPKILFYAKVTKPFTNYHKFMIENFLSGTITFGVQKWSSWDQYKIKLMKCPKLLLPISAAFVCFCSLQRQMIFASPTFLSSKFSVTKIC